MKKSVLTILASAMAVISLVSCGSKGEKPVLNSERDTVSWVMGQSLAHAAQQGFYKFDEKVLAQAFEHTMNKGAQPLTEEEYNNVLQYINFLATAHDRETARNTVESAKESVSQYFEKLVKENPNVKKADEGFYYEVLREGKGPKAQLGQRVEFDYRGYHMLTGNLFDQTYGKRTSIIHVLGKPMFEGLQYGMQMMTAGSKYRFYFPQELAFGANGSEGVPPYTALIYEIELHKIYLD